MEIIRKKICFETARSRQQGLLAYIKYSELTSAVTSVSFEKVCRPDPQTGEMCPEVVAVDRKIGESEFSYVTMSDKDGNYGNFVCNPYISGGIGAELFGVGYVNYMDIIYRYNKIHNILFDGMKLKRIIINNDIFYVKKFADRVNLYDYNIVNGSDLIKIGIKPGKKLGWILNELLESVVDEPDTNTKERLIFIAKHLLEESGN